MIVIEDLDPKRGYPRRADGQVESSAQVWGLLQLIREEVKPRLVGIREASEPKGGDRGYTTVNRLAREAIKQIEMVVDQLGLAGGDGREV